MPKVTMAPCLAAATPCLTTWAQDGATASGMWWSEGQNSRRRSSGFGPKATIGPWRPRCCGPRAPAGRCPAPWRFAWPRSTRNRWSSDSTQMTLWLSDETRSSVRLQAGSLPSMSGTNCLGNSLRLSGQSRVPERSHQERDRGDRCGRQAQGETPKELSRVHVLRVQLLLKSSSQQSPLNPNIRHC
jgi:hypothetical protein